MFSVFFLNKTEFERGISPLSRIFQAKSIYLTKENLSNEILIDSEKKGLVISDI